MEAFLAFAACALVWFVLEVAVLIQLSPIWRRQALFLVQRLEGDELIGLHAVRQKLGISRLWTGWVSGTLVGLEKEGLIEYYSEPRPSTNWKLPELNDHRPWKRRRGWRPLPRPPATAE